MYRVVREPGIFGSGSDAAPGFSKFSAPAPAQLPINFFGSGSAPAPPEPHRSRKLIKNFFALSFGHVRTYISYFCVILANCIGHTYEIFAGREQQSFRFRVFDIEKEGRNNKTFLSNLKKKCKQIRPAPRRLRLRSLLKIRLRLRSGYKKCGSAP